MGRPSSYRTVPKSPIEADLPAPLLTWHSLGAKPDNPHPGSFLARGSLFLTPQGRLEGPSSQLLLFSSSFWVYRRLGVPICNSNRFPEASEWSLRTTASASAPTVSHAEKHGLGPYLRLHLVSLTDMSASHKPSTQRRKASHLPRRCSDPPSLRQNPEPHVGLLIQDRVKEVQELREEGE